MAATSEDRSQQTAAPAGADPAALAALLALPGCTKTPRGWRVTCPAHDDRHPSLDVDQGADGRLLLTCRSGGCTAKQIVTALGLALADLYPPKPKPSTNGHGKPASSRRIAGVYDYRDESGALLYQTVRYDPKSFSQRHRDAGQWVWNLNGCRRVLYRLAALVAADPAEPVFLAEGEKDCNNLAALGLIATTNAMGAEKWEPAYSEMLRGRHVVILPDNDPPGEKHAAKVAPALAGVADSVRVLRLPGLPDKGDVSDWLSAGGTADELRRLAAGCPEWTPPATAGTTAPAQPDGANDPDTAGPYRTIPAGLVWRRPAGDSHADEPLCNFTALIDSVLIEDNGAEQRQSWQLTARLGARRLSFAVPVNQFATMHWPHEQLGPAALVYPGRLKADHARVAIQMLSAKAHGGDIPTERRYLHTGWRSIGGAHYYLTAAGGIGAADFRPDLTAHVSGPLARYSLPEPPIGAELVSAVRASLAAVGVGPDRITVPTIGASYRAPLGPCDVSPFLTGRTQVFKSELAALALQHFGAAMDARNLTASWTSTGNALEGILFHAKDTLVVIDDFIPTGDQNSVQRAHAQADRVLRAAGNQQGRQRMNADGSIRPEMPPRALALATGEDVPRGESLRSRLLIVDVRVGDVDATRLSAAQIDAATGRYAAAMAGFLRWLAPRAGTLSADLHALLLELRAGWAERAGWAGSSGGGRLPDNLAQIAAGWHLWLAYAEEAGAVTADEAAAWWQRVMVALAETSAEQPEHQAASNPGRRYLALLASAIHAGRAHLSSLDGGAPTEPRWWGWQEREIGGMIPRREWHPHGNKVGWVETDGAGDEHLYLEPAAAFAEVARLARDSGDPITLSEQAMRRQLRELGALASTDSGRGKLTVRRTIEGNRLHVLHVLGASLHDESAAQPAQPAQSVAAAPNLSTNGAGSGPVSWAGLVPANGKPAQTNRPTTPLVEHESAPAGPVGPVGPVALHEGRVSVRDARAVLSAPDLAEAAQLANQLRAAHATNGAKEDRERHGPLANLWAEVPAVLATFDHDRAAGHCSPALLGNLRLLVDQLLPTAAPPAEPEPVSAEVNAAAVSGGPLDDPAGVAATEPSEPEPADMPPEVAELRRRLESGELDRWAGGPIRLDRAHSISPGLLSRAAERRLIGWERAVTPKARAAAAELCHELVEALDASTPAEIGGGA